MEIDSFLSYLKNIKRYSALTITAYKEDLNQFREFCEKVELIRQDEEITSKMVRRFEMGLMSGGLKIGGVDGEEKLRPMTARSVRRKLSSLRTYFRYLVREGKLTEDPTEIVVAPKMGKRLPVFVPDYQMDEVLDKHASDKDFANIRDRMVLMTAYYTGMRRSELVALKLEDIDFGGAVIRVNGKGDKQRMKNKKCKCCWGTVIAMLVALLGAAAAVMVLLRRHHTACTEELDDGDLVEYLGGEEHEDAPEE